MATNNEIAAFEGFKFNVGDMVRLIAERAATDEVFKQIVNGRREVAAIPAVMGMVVYRSLIQDESGISRTYAVRGVAGTNQHKEFELESLTNPVNKE